MATISGNRALVVELLKHDKLDVNLQDKHGCTALLMASMNGYTRTVVEFLRHNKVMMNLQATSGHTALSLASIHGHADVVWELLKHNPFEALEWAIAKSIFHSTNTSQG